MSTWEIRETFRKEVAFVTLKVGRNPTWRTWPPGTAFQVEGAAGRGAEGKHEGPVFHPSNRNSVCWQH